MATTQEGLLVHVFGACHHYRGYVLNEDRRLAEVLSDSNKTILELHDATVAGAGVRPVEVRCGSINLLKKDFLLVIPEGRHEAPVRRCNNFQQKVQYGAVLTMAGYVLSGMVHLPTRATPWMLLDEDANVADFFGMTGITIHSAPHDWAPKHCDVAVVRRGAIEALHMTSAPVPKQQGPAPAPAAAISPTARDLTV